MRREVNGFKSDAKQLWERACSHIGYSLPTKFVLNTNFVGWRQINRGDDHGSN
ncbi:hypothetical protein OKW11_002118 [Pseudomonas baetica]|nr:hypothetical protein [Pseudomonas baetica]